MRDQVDEYARDLLPKVDLGIVGQGGVQDIAQILFGIETRGKESLDVTLGERERETEGK